MGLGKVAHVRTTSMQRLEQLKVNFVKHTLPNQYITYRADRNSVRDSSPMVNQRRKQKYLDTHMNNINKMRNIQKLQGKRQCTTGKFKRLQSLIIMGR